MKTRRFSTVMLVVALVLVGAAVPGQAAPPAPAVPARVASFSCADVTQILPVECQALVTLYSTTNGSNWNTADGWLATNTPCDDWYGVTCSGEHVSELRLGSNNLVGPIPQDIRQLTHLTVLDLRYNKLSGWIPSVLGELSSLTSLRLGYNSGLTWLIPWELGSLTNLREFSLTGCNLFGPIPSTFANLTNLESLDLSFNYLSGWVTVVGELPQLRELSLRNNQQLRGELPIGLTSHMPVSGDTILHYDATALCEPTDQAFQDFLAALETESADLRRTSSACGALPAAVQISKSGADVVSTWTHLEPNKQYDIHRGATPYFAPSPDTKLAELPVAPTGVYTDTGVLATAGHYFYVVQSKDTAPEPDLSADSNETAQFTYELVKGQ